MPFPIVIGSEWQPTEPSDDALVIDVAHRLGLVEEATRAVEGLLLHLDRGH